MNVIDFIAARLKEPTTWGGISAVLTAVGVSVRPDLWQAITTLGASIGGVLLVLIPEAPKNPPTA